MKKLLALAILVCMAFLFSTSSAQAQIVYLNDTFTRTTLSPWSYFWAGCGETVVIFSNTLYERTGVGNCLAMAAHVYVVEIENFTIDVDYTHQVNNQPIIEWVNTTSATVSIIFDTQNNLIKFDRVSAMIEYPAFPSIFYAFPYVYTMSAGNTYNIRIEKFGDNIKIFIDGSKIFDQSMPDFLPQWNAMGLGLFSTVDTFLNWDNVVVTSYVPLKPIPSIVVGSVPSSPVALGTEVTIYCSPTPGDLVVHLEYPYGTEVTHPYTTSSLPQGNHYFYCWSEEDAIYASGSNGYILTVSGAPTTTIPTTPYGNFSWYTPIPQVNATEWQIAGYGWVLPFFTPIILATIFLIFISGVAAAIGGLQVGGLSMLAMIFIYSIMGIYPIWVGIIMIVLGAFIVAKFGKGIFAGA